MTGPCFDARVAVDAHQEAGLPLASAYLQHRCPTQGDTLVGSVMFKHMCPGNHGKTTEVSEPTVRGCACVEGSDCEEFHAVRMRVHSSCCSKGGECTVEGLNRPRGLSSSSPTAAACPQHLRQGRETWAESARQADLTPLGDF